MKKIKILFFILLAGMGFITACVNDSHEQGDLLDPTQISFSVEQDYSDPSDSGGNTVILRNNTPGTVSMWDFVIGRSTRAVDTVHFAFEGTYEIKFSALTAGGVVEMDPVTVTVTSFNSKYVDDPMWTLLSGGKDQEKTWVLDLDSNGVSKLFLSPIYFMGLDFAEDSTCAPGGDCWSWPADWPGNQWISPAGNYGTMTFNLKGGPFVTVDQRIEAPAGTTTGTYFLDKDAKTLSFTDVFPLRNNYDMIWGTAKIISLTENTLQLAFRHATKAEWEIYNYISKEYGDAWEPPVVVDEGDPNFDHGDQEEIIAVTGSKTWKLDTEVPYNWTNISGGFLNGWASRADIIATGWAPYGDADVANIDDVRITFTTSGGITIVQDGGASESGTFALDAETNTITFTDITPTIPIASWVSVGTTSLNQWKIVIVERNDLTDAVEGMWVGKRDESGTKDEYMVFHLLPD